MKLCTYTISSCFECHYYTREEKSVRPKSAFAGRYTYTRYFCKKARRVITVTDLSRNSFCPLPDAPARIKKGSK
jgi:hypothetical protein